jgi:hypothetical protein
MSQKRRNFLKSIGFAGIGLSLSTGLANARPALKFNKRDLSNININGKVMSGGKGIAGVAVTDGINVTVTDVKGNYVLDSNATAEFVYISIPSGYAISNEKGIAKFYQKVEHQKGKFKADFDIQKSNQDDKKHGFIVWADPQVQTKRM